MEMETISMDMEKLLKRVTGKSGWKEASGMAIGVGIDYFYDCKDGTSAFINIDQDCMIIEVDGEEFYSGEIIE